MIAVEGTLSPEYEFNGGSDIGSFLNDVQKTFLHNGIPDRVIVTIDIFVDSNRYRKEPSVDYYILKVVSDLDLENAYPDDFVQKLFSHIHQKTLRLRYRQTVFFFEMETYKEVFQGTDKRFIHVPESINEDYVTMEWLGSTPFMRDFTFCLDKEAIIPLHKVQVCPYIQIMTDDFSVNFKNDFLILRTYNLTTTLSQFEYELKNDTINICFSDFLPFYYAMTKPTEVSTSQTVYVCKEMLQIISLTICLKVSL